MTDWELIAEARGSMQDKSGADWYWLARQLADTLERLRSWDGLMELLDEYWPEDLVPTLPDDNKRDPGPRIVSLIRWVARAEADQVLRDAELLDAEADMYEQEFAQHGRAEAIALRRVADRLRAQGGAA